MLMTVLTAKYDSRRAGEPDVRPRRAYRAVLAEPPSPSCPAIALAKADACVADRYRQSSGGAAFHEVADPRPRQFSLGPEIYARRLPQAVVHVPSCEDRKGTMSAWVIASDSFCEGFQRSSVSEKQSTNRP